MTSPGRRTSDGGASAQQLDPDAVHLPGVYVHRIVEVGPGIEKRIEKRTVRAGGGS